MQERTEQFDVGVLVARFQVHELHPAQRDLLTHVCNQHDKVIVFLGLSPLPTTLNNPLDFEARKQMILADFPDVNVLYVKDQYDDAVWSRKLDAQIADVVGPRQTVVLYGGRDSFIPHYKGKYPTRELQDTEDRFLSGTAVRRAIGRAATKGSPDFRAGVIWASQARFPTSFQCVDVAPLNEVHTKVLLGRKPGETKFRFLGGFVEHTDTSLEQAARRETAEEGGVELAETLYVGSTSVEDWRYRGEPDQIMTALFAGKVLHGRPRPGDDIEEIRWFDIIPELGRGDLITPTTITPEKIAPVHRTLLQMLVRYLKGA